MLALGIETATWMGSVALVDDREGVLVEIDTSNAASHSERLLPTVERAFKEAGRGIEECSIICVSVGPGSFTGLRIGIATVKGLAYAANKPAAGVSTLEVLARGLPYASFPLCPVIDARKKEVFASFYEWRKDELIRVHDEVVIKPEPLIEKIKGPTIFLGNGLIPYGGLFKERLRDLALFVPPAFSFPRASVVAELGLRRLAEGAVSDPEEILPIYIRPSEAELNWKQG